MPTPGIKQSIQLGKPFTVLGGQIDQVDLKNTDRIADEEGLVFVCREGVEKRGEATNGRSLIL